MFAAKYTTMNPNLNFILRLGLSYGLHDREAFVEAFTGTFGELFSDPEKAGSTSEFLLSQMEALKQDLEISRLVDALAKGRPADDGTTLGEQLTKLTEQLASLQKTIEKQQP